jgi:hypothetical protein
LLTPEYLFLGLSNEGLGQNKKIRPRRRISQSTFSHSEEDDEDNKDKTEIKKEHKALLPSIWMDKLTLENKDKKRADDKKSHKNCEKYITYDEL